MQHCNDSHTTTTTSAKPKYVFKKKQIKSINKMKEIKNQMKTNKKKIK